MLDLTPYTRWITASVFKHIDGRRGGIPVYIEGQVRTTQEEFKFFEMRLGGPHATPNGSSGEYKLYVEVNILCQSNVDEKDVYLLKKLLGIAQQALNADICVFKYGDEPGDDPDAYVGVLKLETSEPIEVHDFGQIEPTIKTVQGSSEAHYCMQI